MMIIEVKKMGKNLIFASGVVVLAGLSANVWADSSVRTLASTCTGCHGTEGKPIDEITGTLAGRSQAELMSAMMDFRTDKQPSPIMGQIAKGFSEEQLKVIAQYFSEVK